MTGPDDPRLEERPENDSSDAAVPDDPSPEEDVRRIIEFGERQIRPHIKPEGVSRSPDHEEGDRGRVGDAMMQSVTAAKVTKVLLRSLPELEPSVRENEAVFGDPLAPHTLVGMVVNPYLMTIASPHVDEKAMARLIDCAEDIVRAADEEVLDAIHVTFLERIFFEAPEVRAASLRFMGPETRAIYEQLRGSWTRWLEDQAQKKAYRERKQRKT